MRTKLLRKLRKKAKKEIGIAYHRSEYYVGRRYLIEDKKLMSLYCTKISSFEEAKNYLDTLRRDWIKGIIYAMKHERSEKTINSLIRKL